MAMRWREATQAALYGPDGFYRRHAPAAHFRTSVHVTSGGGRSSFAASLVRLAALVTARTVVDLGSGRGELLHAVRELAPRLRLVGVEMAERPAALQSAIDWVDTVPLGLSNALIVANEWLDNVPVDVAEVDDDGVVRVVLVDAATGVETLGPAVSGRDEAWLRRWWPLDGAEPGRRAEIGWPRDDAWAQVVGALTVGVAVAIDYDHTAGDRPAYGTLSAFRGGRRVAPVPDGSCDLTSHVALDACALAGEKAGATQTLLLRQREALRALGVGGALPPTVLARTDPPGYARLLAESSVAGELLAPAGLGGFGWLLQGVDQPLPLPLVPAGVARS